MLKWCSDLHNILTQESGQLHKPITAHPFKEAGINGFDPIKPFKKSTNFLTADQPSEFHWPSLLELNDDLSPFPWSSEEERRQYLSGDTISTLPVMYTGPPPSAPMYSTPTIPPLSIRSWSTIQRSAKFFFISHRIGTNDAREWRLFRVALQESMSSYPSCLQDGHFLVEFYISHHSDSWYNTINTCFWLQYQTVSELQSPLSKMDTHLIQPSDSSEVYANRHKLLPFRKWVNLTHQDTFIHGPFDFATVNGWKTQGSYLPTRLGCPQNPL